MQNVRNGLETELLATQERFAQEKAKSAQASELSQDLEREYNTVTDGLSSHTDRLPDR